MVYNRNHWVTLEGTLEGIYRCFCHHCWSIVGSVGLNYRHRRLHHQRQTERRPLAPLCDEWVYAKIASGKPHQAERNFDKRAEHKPRALRIYKALIIEDQGRRMATYLSVHGRHSWLRLIEGFSFVLRQNPTTEGLMPLDVRQGSHRGTDFCIWL